MYAWFEEFTKLKRRKLQLEGELCIEHHGSIEDDLLMICCYCGARFPSFEVARSDVLYSSGQHWC